MLPTLSPRITPVPLYGRYIAPARKGLAESANKDCRRALMNDRTSLPRCASTACSGKEA